MLLFTLSFIFYFSNFLHYSSFAFNECFSISIHTMEESTDLLAKISRYCDRLTNKILTDLDVEYPQLPKILFLHLSFIMILGILRHYVSVLLSSQKKVDLEQIKDSQALIRARYVFSYTFKWKPSRNKDDNRS